MVRMLPTLVALAGLPTMGCRWDDPPVENSTSDTGTGTGSDTGGSASSSTSSPPDLPPDMGDAWDPVPDPLPLPDTDVADLAGRIDAIVNAAPVSGYLQSIQIVDHDSGQVLYERDPDLLLRPASNTKLFSTAAAMSLLGKEHRVGMRVFATAEPDAEGVVDGDLYLLGLHDFSPHAEFFADPGFPFATLAADLAAAGVTGVTGTSVVLGEFLVEGATTAKYDAVTHLDAAAQRWDAALTGAGVVGPVPTALSGFDPPAGVVELAALDAPPLEVTVVPLNVLSHNGFADVLARHMAYERTGQSTLAAAGAQISAFIASIGIDDPGVVLGDGAGFAGENRLSARAVVHLIAHMLDGPLADPWVDTFTVGGVRGTLDDRLTGPDTLGRVYAKTGTLFDTVALSGIVHNRHDDRRYLFSHLIWNQNQPLDIAAARAAQDAVVTELAAKLRAPAPVPPVFTSAAAEGSSEIQLTWKPAPGADAQVVWISSDGWTWSRDDARLVAGTDFRLTDAPLTEPLYVRVSSYSETGGIGRPSDTLVVKAAEPTATRVLLVDANDHWENAGEDNPRGFAHGFLTRVAEALPPDLALDSVANEVVRDGGVELAEYDGVIWLLGEEGEEHGTFSTSEQARIRSYLDAGGALLASGANTGHDLAELGTPEDRAFFEEIFHATHLGDSAGTFVVDPVGEGSTLPRIGFFAPGGLIAGRADRLAAGPDADGWLEYVGGQGGAAAVSYAGTHRAVLFGFPLEVIDTRSHRALILEAALTRLGL